MNLSNILLAGIQGVYTLYSWFSNSFKVPSGWKNEKVLLNFDAVDYEATVFVNGKKAGFHRGGYFRFTVDVTQYVKIGQENEL
jgi:beta-galactosidase/beta-glucuronidase